MDKVIIGLCFLGLAACILYWEWRADRKWERHFDVEIPRDHRRYFEKVLDEYRNDS